MALQACGYTGDGTLKSSHIKTQPATLVNFLTVRGTHTLGAARADKPKYRLATIVSEKVELPRHRIHT